MSEPGTCDINTTLSFGGGPMVAQRETAVTASGYRLFVAEWLWGNGQTAIRVDVQAPDGTLMATSSSLL